MVPEVFAKKGRVREVHKISYFLNRRDEVFQQCFGFQYHILVNPLSGSFTATFFTTVEKSGTQE